MAPRATSCAPARRRGPRGHPTKLSRNDIRFRRRLHAVNGFGEVEGIFANYLRWLESRSVESGLFEGVDSAELELAEA